MMDLSKLKALNETTVIRIEDEPRGFRYTGPPRFLDGDIWAVIEKDGSEQLITRFLNLADRGEMDQQYASIIAEHREYYGDWNISGMFDHSLAE